MKNPFDELVNFANPVAGARRLQARQAIRIMNSGYSEGGASKRKNSFKGWRWSGGSTKEDIEANLLVLRQRSRALYMESPIARAAVNRVQTNVVGQGLKLHSVPTMDVLNISREEARIWARQWEREFALWADSNLCDQAGLNNFYELQQIAILSWLQSGDVIVLLPMESNYGMPYDTRVHLIEADRVCNPSSIPQGVTIRDGVEISKTGRVVAYHIKNSHPLAVGIGDQDANKWIRVPVFGSSGRRNILHLMVAERPEQYRGVPFLAPVIESCHQISSYTKTELAAAVVAGLFTVFIKSDTPDSPFAESRPEDKGRNDTEADYNYALGPGAVVPLGQDEEIQTANPSRPNKEFDGFVNSVATQIGAALNVPSELLLLSFTKSYSASRAALLEAWKGFRMWRAWMANDFCQPIANELLIEAILRGRIKAPGFFDDPLVMAAWCNATWHGPSPGQIDPTREVAAAKMRVEENFSTRARETAELTGGDFEENVAERAAEEQLRLDAGLVTPMMPATEPVDHRKQQDLEE